VTQDQALATLFLHEIDKRIESLEGSLSGGGAKDYSEYSGMVGEIRGLTRAKQEFKEALSKALQEILEEEAQ
jgi:hypothetical protein